MTRSGIPWLRPLLAFVGVLAASALVWFVGPLVAVAGVVPLAGEPARRATIAAVVLGALAHAVWRTARSARRNRRLMEGLMRRAEKPMPGTPGADELAVITQRFAQAVALLRRSRIGGKHPWLAALTGRPFVYELPWYVIIGAPGAGKTTALVNSGLEFPLADAVGEKVIRGIGGTRNCDWWFASEAVLIDTAGRYTTHDSDRVADRTAWLGFLKLLARYRPRRPINGVLLTISVSDLLSASPEKRAAHANELRQRIEELRDHLGIAFPVYVLVTKTDLLAGFMEFFADFDKDERAQVWGVTFPYQAGTQTDGPLLRMASDFALLEKRLNDCLIDRLHNERDRERRAAVYTFPQQWRVLRQTLFDFLQEMSSGMRAELRPFVRGVYFTSATQEGTPMDRALGGLARALGLTSRILPAARPTGKTFFVTRLLRDVVFAEAGLAGTNLSWRRRRQWLAWGAMGATACMVLAATALSWRAYAGNRDWLTDLRGRLPALDRQVAAAREAPSTDLVAMLPALDALAGFAASGGSPAQHHAALSLGLDRSEALVAGSQDAYLRTLREAFLPRIAARLEQRMRAGAAEHVGLIYESLKAYLMLFGGRNFDAPALRAYLTADWEATLGAGVRPEQREALRRHLDRLLATGEVGAPANADPQLVAAVRSLVASVPLAERAYRRLKQTDFGAEAMPFTVESAGGAGARRVFVRASGQPLSAGVPALYSRAVGRQSLHERTLDVLRQFAREEVWVLGTASGGAGDPAAQKALAEQVRRLYLADYAARWGEFVSDLRLAPSSNLAASAEMANLLARPDSPLVAVLRATVREVSFGGATASASGTAAVEEDPLAPRFDDLKRFVAGQSVEEMQMLLGKLSAHLAAVEDAVKRKALPPPSDATRELQAAAQRAPEPVRGMLLQFADASGAQVFAALRDPLARQLGAEFAPQCVRAVAGRYPLARSGTDEMSREDFVRVFGAGGLIDGYFQRQLAPYVDTSTRPWTYRAADADGRRDAGESLQQFQRAQAIRDAFFRDGGRQLGMRLDFRLLELDAGVSEFVLDVDGQVLKFRPGATATQTLQWPGPGGAGRVRLQLVPSGGGGGPGHVFQGPWALFRLLDRVRVDPGASPERAQLVFDVEGRKARFEVRSPTPLNPLLRRELEQFQCPTRL
ncbi:type VI secretion system membrane subunit TssM [Piscinibacter sp. XHJ-5]|uniref:type VI secretion system membrane subunit TssM n=1 Tax=Piscinibacter sp. XHJ-5 TaxID=3037797 RepID=UPI00245280D7|nr:type VI secretion system membrane subunit TssM [Piscinibacter sp. XHJ-5]